MSVGTMIRLSSGLLFIMNRESEVKIRLMNEGRCDERLKTRVQESTGLTDTGWYDRTN
jgi:hypothetical protein